MGRGRHAKKSYRAGLPHVEGVASLPSHMESHELLKELLKDTSAKQVCADMGLSLSLIYKWAEPPADDSGSGSSNPLDRVKQLIDSTEDDRVARWVA